MDIRAKAIAPQFIDDILAKDSAASGGLTRDNLGDDQGLVLSGFIQRVLDNEVGEGAGVGKRRL